jgi:hypothetical protein
MSFKRLLHTQILAIPRQAMAPRYESSAFEL